MENNRAGDTGRAIVLNPVRRSRVAQLRDPESQLEEAVGLAAAIQLAVPWSETIRVDAPRPGAFFGPGTIDRLRGMVEELDITVLVVNAALSPVQQRNLERSLQTKVIDRTGLILEIFGARARTHEGRLQVELAALTYQRSRLVRSWTHLERQRGGFGFMGGPGESQLEIDRRLTDDRIGKLRRELEGVKRTRALHRRARKRVPYPVVALVGYTNAGKSTLFNGLAGARVMAQDMLFATLDPTMRRIKLPGGRQVILSDTVGFISDLPTNLVAAFRATLEEVSEADVVVHVIDAANDDSATQKQDVEQVLVDLGVSEDPPPIEALNKIDLLDPATRAALGERAARNHDVVLISAVTGEGSEALLAAVERRLNAARVVREFDVDLTDGAAIAWLYEHGDVIGRRDDTARAHLTVSMEESDAARFLNRFGRAG